MSNIKLKTEKRKTSISRSKVRKAIAGIPNTYKVPQKLWVKFKSVGQKVFNDVMEQSLDNQELSTHPKMDTLPDTQWKTICWNMACYAAWSVADSGDKLKKGDTVIDINSKGKETKRRKVA